MCLSPYLNSAWQVFSLTRLPMHLIVLLASMRTVTGHLAHDATAHESWSTASDPDKAAAIVANFNQDGVERHSRRLLESGYEWKVSGCEDSYYGCVCRQCFRHVRMPQTGSNCVRVQRARALPRIVVAPLIITSERAILHSSSRRVLVAYQYEPCGTSDRLVPNGTLYLPVGVAD